MYKHSKCLHIDKKNNTEAKQIFLIFARHKFADFIGQFFSNSQFSPQSIDKNTVFSPKNTNFNSFTDQNEYICKERKIFYLKKIYHCCTNRYLA